MLTFTILLEASTDVYEEKTGYLKVRQSDIMNQCDEDGSDDEEDGDGSHHGSNGMLFLDQQEKNLSAEFSQELRVESVAVIMAEMVRSMLNLWLLIILRSALSDQCGKTLAAEFSQEQR
ncbi:Autophagy-related protein 9 [Frankliniella fusca]|uniref:Autophagy-related protein 9 n=1 Tax=Frankliniella fusca TaxID=407009 RepID=A0AAE1HA50_9NEOP|nr:Autophagy-related protein 9 [Frankliniella fusca]